MITKGLPLPPLSTIGILGGGQLGRMLAIAAAEMGMRCHIYCPDADSPAFDVSIRHTRAAYDDLDALTRFAQECDVITYEFENVPAATAAHLAALRPVCPGTRALAISQDRLQEKQFFSSIGIEVAPWRPVETADDLSAALAEIGPQTLLKTRRFGYDGKGQVRVSAGDDPAVAIDKAGAGPYVLEGIVPFTREISVIAARDAAGATCAYDPAENIHRDQILHSSAVPGDIAPATAKAARVIATRILDALDYVGVIGVEFFVIRDGEADRLLVNEFAPRVHNTGHWTQDACLISQFEMHIRAICGWPLGSPRRHSDCLMTNLIGEDALQAERLSGEPDARVHLYGKAEVRAGRKMGHVTRLLRPVR
ncbi:MAG: 5-(carboxyamino)imidazole ribonucleotide synthase [Rhodobiaceae bacterium]|nr:5-(carboxyamino)imidazole ribonucleotide synthase [Rhodobiaceae bacterium]MCC0057233.1 5-(carboxyamino)imidazole ribonucleotide synthase [Rhodobiaceae bacterium]